MFDKIELKTVVLSSALSSSRLTVEDMNNPNYDKDNIVNSRFRIYGSVDCFTTPPVSDFARQNLFHLQGFHLFHYGYSSFTERANYRSFLILYTYDGKGSLTYRNRSYTLESGDGFFINCTDPHLYRAESNHWDVGVLHIRGPLLEELHSQYLTLAGPLFHMSTEDCFQRDLEELLSIYQYPHIHRDWHASACINTLLLHLLLHNSKENTGNGAVPNALQALLDYMNTHYTEHLTLDDLSDYCHLNKYHLSKEFKKYTGFSPNDYLITMRIDQARTLLRTTDLTASEISHEVGIHDINNFMKLFRKKTGMTPIEYRRSAGYPF